MTSIVYRIDRRITTFLILKVNLPMSINQTNIAWLAMAGLPTPIAASQAGRQAAPRPAGSHHGHSRSQHSTQHTAQHSSVLWCAVLCCGCV
eukprot:COSAG01_NODE_23653_length_806_cov_12.611033_2_plen_91_part_00